MHQAIVTEINIATESGQPLHSVESIRAVPGYGLEGDRFYRQAEEDPTLVDSGRDVTLIEAEALDALGRDYDIKLEPRKCRRNIVTTGVALAHLIGRTFRVGDVRMEGARMAEPCSHLESLTQKGVQRGLIHRAGIRARVLNEGIIRVGDRIEMG